MNTLKLRITFFCCLLLMSFSIAQKCKSSNKMVRQAKKHLSEDKIIKATKFQRLFSKFSQAGNFNFVKSDKGYYLRIRLIRELRRRIDIMKNNPLVLQFEDNSFMTLYPNMDFPGKFTLPVTTEINNMFYTVSEEQLEILSKQSVSYVKIYFTSDKVPDDQKGVDDLGDFFDYEIKSKRYQINLQEPAKCMLQS